MFHNELKNEYFLKLKTDKNNLIKILKYLDGRYWKKMNKNDIGLNNIKEKCKLLDNRIIFNEYYFQRSLLNQDSLLEIKEFLNIVYNKEILEILEKYFNKKPFIRKIDAFHSENNGSEKNEMLKQKWHIDDWNNQVKKNKKFIKLFIPLCDVNEKNGATKIIKGSRENLPKSIDFSKLQSKRFEDDFIRHNYDTKDIFNLNSKFGEVFLARTDGFHKGGFVEKGFRTIIIVEYSC